MPVSQLQMQWPEILYLRYTIWTELITHIKHMVQEWNARITVTDAIPIQVNVDFNTCFLGYSKLWSNARNFCCTRQTNPIKHQARTAVSCYDGEHMEVSYEVQEERTNITFTIYTQVLKLAEYSISMTWMVKNRKKNCSQQMSPVKLGASNLLDIKDKGIVYYEKRLHA